MERLEQITAKLLLKKKKTIAVAESCTGGLLSHRLTNIAGSSQYFKVGMVVYSDIAKRIFLKLPSSLIKKKGLVSKETVIYMAKRIRIVNKTEFGIGISGVAGPKSIENKPVGLVFIALASKGKTFCRKFNFKGKRLSIKQKAATAALKILKECLV